MLTPFDAGAFLVLRFFAVDVFAIGVPQIEEKRATVRHQNTRNHQINNQIRGFWRGNAQEWNLGRIALNLDGFERFKGQLKAIRSSEKPREYITPLQDYLGETDSLTRNVAPSFLKLMIPTIGVPFNLAVWERLLEIINARLGYVHGIQPERLKIPQSV